MAPTSAAPISMATVSLTPASAAVGGAEVSMATTGAGPALTGKDGMTLYVHAGDTATSSTCTGGCVTAWPPLTVPAGSQATAGAGVTGTLATFTRADDGTTQVTYNGQPLYYWQGDKKAGDATGDGVGGFNLAKP